MSSVYSEQHSEGGSLVRDNNRSSDGWEMRPDGKWYKIDYYKVQQEEKKESGLEILERFFVGSFAVTKNEEWMKSKNITKVLVLGGNSGIGHVSGAILRILEVNDDTLFDSLDESVTLIKEAIAEGESSGASILMVCPNMLTYCPVVVIAYLMAVMGWSLKTARERVEGIFKISVVGFMMFTLERWEEVLQSRKSVSVKREVIGTKEVDTGASVVQAPTITSLPAPTVMTVTNPIAVAPPVTYANPVYASYQPTYMAAPTVYSPPISTGPLIEAAPMFAPTVAAPAYQSYTPSYSGYQYPSFDYGANWGNSFSSYGSYPQFSNYGYSQASYQPSFSYVQPQQYVQPAQTFSYAQPQQSYTVQAAPQQQQQHAQQQQVVQTTTTTSNNVLRGHSSWHSGGVRVNNSHGHSGHRF